MGRGRGSPDGRGRLGSGRPRRVQGRAMLETVSFKNFKALRDVTIPLERFTVLAGPNASGKTTVLQGLDSLFFLRHENASFFREERNYYVLRSHGAAGDTSVEIR